MFDVNNDRKDVSMREYTIALAGPPYSETIHVFNALTGMNQCTEYWPGTMLKKLQGKFLDGDIAYHFLCLPDVSTLLSRSEKETIIQNILMLSPPDATVIICDASNMKETLSFLLQVLELTQKVLVFVITKGSNDQAIDFDVLSSLLKIPFIVAPYRKTEGLVTLIDTLDYLINTSDCEPYLLPYSPILEEVIDCLLPYLYDYIEDSVAARWVATRLLANDPCYDSLVKDSKPLVRMITSIQDSLSAAGIDLDCYNSLLKSAYDTEAANLLSKSLSQEVTAPRNLRLTYIFLSILLLLGIVLILILRL